jgi:hypothetical protein
VILETELVRTPAEVLDHAAELRDDGDKSPTVKAIDKETARSAHRAEFATLVFNDRIDAWITQAIPLTEAGETAPGDLGRAGHAPQP